MERLQPPDSHPRPAPRLLPPAPGRPVQAGEAGECGGAVFQVQCGARPPPHHGLARPPGEILQQEQPGLGWRGGAAPAQQSRPQPAPPRQLAARETEETLRNKVC